MASVEDLYKSYGVLADAKDKAGEHDKEYLSILSAVEGGNSEKRLAAQFIPRFFKYFPDLREQAIHAQLDLCEDEDNSIRRQAIRELPNLCRDSTENHFHISDVLTQLLQTDDPQEIIIVNNALISLFKLDAKNTLGGLFNQILTGEDVVRERAIKFLGAKFKTLPQEIITKEVEEFVIEKSKEVLADVTGEEFVNFMKILSGLSSMQTLQGRQQLVELATDQADLESEFQPSEPDNIDRLFQCIRQTIPLFSKNVQSTKFVSYICEKVLPVLQEIRAPAVEVEEKMNGSSTEEEKKPDAETEKIEGEQKEEEKKEEAAEKKEEESVESKKQKAEEERERQTTEVRLEVLKLLAQMAINAADITENQLQCLYNALLEYMPLPPPELESMTSESSEEPQLQFSVVECLMHTFHCLARKTPEFLTNEDNAERLKDFRIRLQYFARGVQVYMKQLRMALQGKSGSELKSEENKLKVAALRITSNINILIKDLMHNPPSYKSTIVLSWRPVTKPAASTTGQEQAGKKKGRPSPIVFNENEKSGPVKKARGSVPYSPPGGKYSDKAGKAPDGGDPNYANVGNYGSNYGNYNRGYGNYNRNRGNRGRGRNRRY